MLIPWGRALALLDKVGKQRAVPGEFTLNCRREGWGGREGGRGAVISRNKTPFPTICSSTVIGKVVVTA